MTYAASQTHRAVILLATLCFLSTPGIADAQWQEGPGALANVSQNAVAADAQGRVYNINGKSQFGPWLTGLDCAHRFDFCTQTWEELPVNGWSTYGVDAVVHSDGHLYQTGGLTGMPGLMLRFNTTTDT